MLHKAEGSENERLSGRQKVRMQCFTSEKNKLMNLDFCHANFLKFVPPREPNIAESGMLGATCWNGAKYYLKILNNQIHQDLILANENQLNDMTEKTWQIML